MRVIDLGHGLQMRRVDPIEHVRDGYGLLSSIIGHRRLRIIIRRAKRPAISMDNASATAAFAIPRVLQFSYSPIQLLHRNAFRAACTADLPQAPMFDALVDVIWEIVRDQTQIRDLMINCIPRRLRE
jgi:hypothetical protein